MVLVEGKPSQAVVDVARKLRTGGRREADTGAAMLHYTTRHRARAGLDEVV